MNLKPQDVLVTLKLLTTGSVAYGKLAESLGMSPSEVHAAVKRAAGAGLIDIIDPRHRKVRRKALFDFLIKGVARAFPVKPGPVTRGMPTAHAAVPLSSAFVSEDGLIPVWPDAEGGVRGYEIAPLYGTVPFAARQDSELYELLVLVDALRVGRARERELAEEELSKRILPASSCAKIAPYGITENDIDNWSQSYAGSEQRLPDLLRRLILFLVPGGALVSLRFPANKAVYEGGFDGVLQTRIPTKFSNSLSSVWEISTRKDIRVKANEDYCKRSKNPQDVVPANTTYIVVTGRIWRDKEKWIKKQRQEGVWADVRAYDAVDIAQWLVQAPAVHTWLCEVLGNKVTNLDSVEEFFEEWSARSAPRLNERVVLAGREKEQQCVYNWLNGRASTLISVADTLEESVVFLCASIIEANDSHKENWLSRTVIVRSEDAWKALRKRMQGMNESALILVPSFPEYDGNPYGFESHFIFIPREAAMLRGNRPPDLQLGPLDRELLANVIQELNMGQNADARKRAYDCGGKLSVLQRLMGYTPKAPDWVRDADHNILLALLLAREWNPDNPADMAVLMQLADGINESSIRPVIEKLKRVADPPLRAYGQNIKWRAPIDAWEWIKGFLSKAILKRFATVCVEILKQPSPRFDMEPKDRRYAALHEATLLETSALRRGLAESLAYLVGDDFLNGQGVRDNSGIVDYVVSEILRDASWKLWATLDENLSLLAEASPSAFIESLEKTLESSGEIGTLFQQAQPGDDGFFSSCCHAGLVQALEVLAWYPKHFPSVISLLVRLHSLRNDTDISCTPFESLAKLFDVRIRQSDCGNQQRSIALDKILQNNRDLGWALITHALGSMRGGVIDSNCRPIFRVSQIPSELESYSPQDMLQYWRFLGDKTVTIVREDPGLLLSLFRGGIAGLIIDDIFSWIEELSDSILQRDAQFVRNLQNCIRRWVELEYLRKSGEQDSEERIDRAIRLIELLAPKDITERNAWLFSRNVILFDPAISGSNSEDQRQAVQDKRSQAVSEILQEDEGFNLLLRMAGNIDYPKAIGETLAIVDQKETYLDSIIEVLKKDDGAAKEVAVFYIHERGRNDLPWLLRQAENLIAEKHDAQAVDILVATDNPPEIRDWLERQSKGIQRTYWQRIDLRFTQIRDNDDFKRMVSGVLKEHRWGEALNLADTALRRHPVRGRAGDYLRILNYPRTHVLSPGEIQLVQGKQNTPYVIADIFKYLDSLRRKNITELVQLELHYSEILRHTDYQLKHFGAQLEQDPDFFVQLLEEAYPREPDDDTFNQLSDDEKKQISEKMQKAWKLLRRWNGYPGKNLSPEQRDIKLRSWCNRVLARAKELDRFVMGQRQLGEVLNRVPANEDDGVWPCLVAREFVEQGSTDIATALHLAHFNNSGPYCKSRIDGGERERSIALQYQENAARIRDRYEGTARVLDALAEDYFWIAEHDEKETEKILDP